MLINYFAVLACGIASILLGIVWYGPLFGKKWMEIVGATAMDLEKRKEMQKSARPLYAVSFVLALLQAFVLALFIGATGAGVGIKIGITLLLWLAFIIPTVAADAMWNNDSARISWARFLIQAGYYLVLFIIFALILSYWQ